jgi:hypothetical protein
MTFEDLQKETDPYLGTIVLDICYQLGRLVRVDQDDEDYYYVIRDMNGNECWQSAVGSIIPLKGSLRDDLYEKIDGEFKRVLAMMEEFIEKP